MFQSFPTSASAGVRSTELGMITQPSAQAVLRGTGTTGNAVSIRADSGGAEIVTGSQGLTTMGTSGQIVLATSASTNGAITLHTTGSTGTVNIHNFSSTSPQAIVIAAYNGGIRLQSNPFGGGLSMPVTSNTEADADITCNGTAGLITTKDFSGDASVSDDGKAGYEIKVNNTTCLAASSIVLVGVNEYAGTGIPVVRVKAVASGSFTLTVMNASSTVALSAPMKIAFLVLNA